MSSPWVSNLNPEQKEAVLHNEGPMLILAGAGSGKTTVLVCRSGRLIEEQIAKPEEILVLTFTNKSARELQARVAHRLGQSAKKLWAGTFHAFGLEVLKTHYALAQLPKSFGVIDQSDASAIVKETLQRITDANRSSVDVEKVLELISKQRSGQEIVGEEEDYIDLSQAVYPHFTAKLQALGVVDFDGLLLKPYEIFKNHPEILAAYQRRFRYFMVDEFQDTNHHQMKLISILSDYSKNLVVVGDDDQSIYGWRGAQVEHILQFPKRYRSCKVVTLVRNYRSHKPILDVANHVIRNNQSRHHKELVAHSNPPEALLPELFLYEDELCEAEGVASQVEYFKNKGFKFQDICILYRSNSQGAMLELNLKKRNIPYKISGGTSFLSRKEIKDIVAYLKVMIRPHELAFRRVLQTPSKGIGEKTIELIEEESKLHRLSFFEASKRDIARLSPKARDTLINLHETLESYKKRLLQGSHPVGTELLNILQDMHYKAMVFESFKEPRSAQKRWELIETFARILQSFFEQGGRTEKSLTEFIDAMELGDVLEDSQKDKDQVQLMTLHACKGLEFSVVCMVGIEEEVIPHKTLGMDIAEERRLFYVGLTRAKQHLVLSRAKRRNRYGRQSTSAPSRFLLEIPVEMLKVFESGQRPLTEASRKSMIQDLFKRIENKGTEPIF